MRPFSPDSEIVRMLESASRAWRHDPAAANVVDAGRAIERAVQLAYRKFQEQAPPRLGNMVQPPSKSFTQLGIKDLLDAVFLPTINGVQPVVPIEHIMGQQRDGFQWIHAANIQSLQNAVRILQAHSRLDVKDEGTVAATPAEKFRLIEAACGICGELGLLAQGDVDDLARILQRDFSRSPRLPPGADPRGIETLIPRPFSQFVAREAEASALLEHVERQHGPIAVEGEGGYGKTALAWHLVEQCRRRGKFSAIVWIRGKRRRLGRSAIEDESGYVKSELDLFQRLGIALGLPRSKLLDSLQEDLDHFLRSNKTLIVLDNWEDFPPGAQAHASWLAERASVVITSRPEVNVLDRIKLEPLRRRELVAILKAEYGTKVRGRLDLTDDDAGRLEKATAGNPLAIWWIVERLRMGGNLRDCLRSLESERHHLLDYCYQSLIEALGTAAQEAATLLLASGGDLSREDMARSGMQDPTIEEGLEALGRIGVLVPNHVSGAFDLTPLSRRYLEKAWADSPQFGQARQAWLAFQARMGQREMSLRNGPFSSPAHALYLHAKATRDTTGLRQLAQRLPEDVWAWTFLGMAQRQFGHSAEAVVSLQEARKLAESVKGHRGNKDYPPILRELALAQKWNGNYPDALATIEAALLLADEVSIRVIHADLVCESGLLAPGVQELLDLVNRPTDDWTREEMRHALVALARHAVRVPGRPDPSERLRMLDQAFQAVQRHGSVLDTVAAACGAANLCYAVAADSRLPLALKLQAAEFGQRVVKPSCVVSVYNRRLQQMEPRQATEAFAELSAALEAERLAQDTPPAPTP